MPSRTAAPPLPLHRPHPLVSCLAFHPRGGLLAVGGGGGAQSSQAALLHAKLLRLGAERGLEPQLRSHIELCGEATSLCEYVALPRYGRLELLMAHCPAHPAEHERQRAEGMVGAAVGIIAAATAARRGRRQRGAACALARRPRHR